MPHEEPRLDDMRAWLALARADLAAGRHAMSATPPFLGDAAFHAQQAAEKALKAFLTWHDEPFRKTHSLTELGHQVSQLDGSFSSELAAASLLTEYAWRFRYPGDHTAPTIEKAQHALSVADRLLLAVIARLPG